MTRSAVAAAVVLGASATALTIAALRRDAGLNAPPWIALLTAFALAVGAIAVLLKAGGRERAVNGVIVILLASFAVIGGWISIGPGARRCSAGYSTEDMRPASDTSCRVAFGAGSIITTAMTVYALWYWRQRRNR